LSRVFDHAEKSVLNRLLTAFNYRSDLIWKNKTIHGKHNEMTRTKISSCDSCHLGIVHGFLAPEEFVSSAACITHHWQCFKAANNQALAPGSVSVLALAADWKATKSVIKANLTFHTRQRCANAKM